MNRLSNRHSRVNRPSVARPAHVGRVPAPRYNHVREPGANSRNDSGWAGSKSRGSHVHKRRIVVVNPSVESTRMISVLEQHGWEVLIEMRPDKLGQVCKQFRPCAGIYCLDEAQLARHEQSIRAALADSGVEWIASVPKRLMEQAPLRTLLHDWFYDFHTLPYDTDRLLVTLGRLFGRTGLGTTPGEPDGTVPDFPGFIGVSPRMQRLKEDIRKVAATDVSVLISGESGTGKEMVACLLHRLSPRKPGPFIAVNCAAIPATLIQSELFGYERGAFTGATQRKIGRIEASDGGTLFLDEIGDLARDLQANLLRFLQEGTIERVGGTVTQSVDARVVSATHVDLQTAIATGAFRDDLFYRLNVCQLNVPALRERVDDIPLLANGFLHSFASRHKLPRKRFSAEAYAVMQAYNWPGNVRELQNRVHQGVVMSNDRLVQPADMGFDNGIVVPLAGQTLDQARDDAERTVLRRTLSVCQHNHSQAAVALGISRATLYRLLEKHQLVGDDLDYLGTAQ